MLVTEPTNDPLLGATVGSYYVEKLIGKGGMGAVYRATHKTLRKHVALKVLLPEYTARADISARFVQEAISAAHVKGINGRTHRNVVEPVDTGTLPDGRHYIMVEFLEGCDLEQYLAARGRLHEREVLGIASQVGYGLHAAHTAVDPTYQRPAPIVHRDLKPANLFVTQDDEGALRIKLLDFGIAKVLGAMRATGIQTGESTVMGSPAYMAPEQVRTPTAVDSRADVFAFGVVIYQLLTGRLPHVSDSALGFVLAKLEQQPPSISSQANVAPVWDAVVMGCLAWDPVRRYQRITDVLRDLVDGTQGHAGVPDARAVIGAHWASFWTDVNTTSAAAFAPPLSVVPAGAWTDALHHHASHPTGGTLASAAGARSAVTSSPRHRAGLVVAGLGAVAVAAGLAMVLVTRTGTVPSRTGTAPATVPPPAAAPPRSIASPATAPAPAIAPTPVPSPKAAGPSSALPGGVPSPSPASESEGPAAAPMQSGKGEPSPSVPTKKKRSKPRHADERPSTNTEGIDRI
jgi:serine/threonine-protein kinase